ncbi:hypothetical protein [Streptomyces ipomoeae]|uniref:hypothetical protein n=1 Tax=Streptomyces ipomoeae TaxID=103232 RepID=UPI001146441D|nr:hypothetical protein [Streptomyces ipomoeae]MDX2931166.1 hypothetical protein [Streptomyces ipomoeae]TQE29583.1 hypothetical protein SipoB123_06045 [Streptomyces ipomoeae]
MDTAPQTTNPSDPVNAPRPAPSNHNRVINLWSALGLILLLPMTLGSWILRLSTERGSRCLAYGEGCSTIPGGVLHGFFWASIAFGLVAAAWPRTRWASARYGAVVLQWCAQVVLCALIVSGA